MDEPALAGSFFVRKLEIPAVARTFATLIRPLCGQLLPKGEAFGAVEGKSLLPLGEGGAEGDG
jgi:hypothetical protein